MEESHIFLGSSIFRLISQNLWSPCVKYTVVRDAVSQTCVNKAVQAFVGGSVCVAASGAVASIAAAAHDLDLIIVRGGATGLTMRFMKGVVLGARGLIENKQSAIDFLVNEINLKPEQARGGQEYYVENRIWDPNADITIDGVKTALQIYAEQAQLKGVLPSYSKWVDQSNIRDAVKELG